MERTRSMAARRPLATFVVLSYGLTWAIAFAAADNPVAAAPGLFGPAVAAIVVLGIAGGRHSVRQLLGRVAQWRVAPGWYLAAVAVPIGLYLAAALLDVALGGARKVAAGEVSPLELVIFVAVVGEELGWRGFALPRLLRSRGPLAASLLLGVIWSCWHLPNFFLPGFLSTEVSFPLYLVKVTSWTVLFTWIWIGSRGSLLIATLFHGMLNLSGILLAGVDPAHRDLLMAGVSVGAAALVAALAWGRSRQRSAAALPELADAVLTPTASAGRELPAGPPGSPVAQTPTGGPS